ncbi:hypothetical protein BaRGS_00023974, partial [Batillaria attramentaria]
MCLPLVTVYFYLDCSRFLRAEFRTCFQNTVLLFLLSSRTLHVFPEHRTIIPIVQQNSARGLVMVSFLLYQHSIVLAPGFT